MEVTSQPKVLFIDDDRELFDNVEWRMSRAGFSMIYAETGLEGLRQLYDLRPDLVLLDLKLPKMDGFTVCQRIREISNVPILVVSSDDSADSISRILDMGADGFVAKPYEQQVLESWARATLRRAASEPTTPPTKEVYSDGHLTINLEERRVLVNGKTTRLSPTEYRLLEMLLQESPRVVTYRSLLEHIWGFEYINDIDYLRVYVWHLRNKLEPNPKKPIYILNELGVGYRFERPYSE